MALSARKGAIVIQRHNEIKFELQDLAARALISSVVRDEHQTDCILDVRITNLDAPSNIHRKPKAVLLFHERETKKKYLQVCLDQPVAYDGVRRHEAKVL